MKSLKTYVFGLHTVNPFNSLQTIKFGWYRASRDLGFGVGFNCIFIGIHFYIGEVSL